MQVVKPDSVDTPTTTESQAEEMARMQYFEAMRRAHFEE